MRIFELIILVVATIWMVIEIRRKKANRPLFLPGSILMVVLFAFHYFFEGIRWQMALAYLIIAIGLIKALVVILSKNDERINRHRRRYGKKSNVPNVFAIIILMVSLLLVLAFPVNTMAEPSGTMAVGTMVYDLIDNQRVELYGNQETETNRKIRIQIWYPSDDATAGDVTPWMYDGNQVLRKVAQEANMPFFVLDHGGLIQSNSYENISISNQLEQYPVVIISHGWTGYRNLHSDMGEMLASHGYIAISIDHSYGALMTVFDDGTEVPVDLGALPDGNTVDNFLDYANQLVNTYAQDDLLVLNHLETLNNSGFFQTELI